MYSTKKPLQPILLMFIPFKLLSSMNRFLLGGIRVTGGGRRLAPITTIGAYQNMVPNGFMLSTSRTSQRSFIYFDKPKWQNPSTLSSSGDGTYFEDDEDQDDDEPLSDNEVVDLEAILFKDFDIQYLRDLEERGEVQLQPFYQRGYKWKQGQASKWIESIIIGYPCVPHIILLNTLDENEEDLYAVFDGQQRLTSVIRYMKDQRGSHWPVKKNDSSFRLQGLTKLMHLNGKVGLFVLWLLHSAPGYT